MNTKLFIIMYHYVRDIKRSRYPAIHGLDTREFNQQLSFIEKNFNVVSPERVIEAACGGKELPEKACMLTFDDGYSDHFNTVFPMLVNRNMQAFFSMPGRIIAEKRLLDVNKIHFILACADFEALWSEFKKLMEAEIRNESLPSMEEYWQNCNLESRFDPPEIIFIKRMLQVELPKDVRDRIIDALYRRFVDVSESVMVQELYMSLEQMKAMKKLGMSFGIHGYEHAWLNRMSKSEAEMDMDLALDTMTGIVDREGWIMCYPYGSHSVEVAQLAQRRGAALGVITSSRIADLSCDDRFALPRLDTNDFPPKSDNYQKYL